MKGISTPPSIFDPTIYVRGESVTFPNGLIIKRGVTSGINAGASVDIVLAVEFPTAIVGAFTTPKTSTANVATGNISNELKTGFTIKNGGSFACSFYWFAIGQ